jgi:hypothetical protein
LQESLTNITEHAGSATVDVLLQVEQKSNISFSQGLCKGISAERLAKTNGSGSDVGVGIAGMRERLKELGGRLEIESDSTGPLLRAFVPFPEADWSIKTKSPPMIAASIAVSKASVALVLATYARAPIFYASQRNVSIRIRRLYYDCHLGKLGF